jgi:hypothetical protein
MLSLLHDMDMLLKFAKHIFVHLLVMYEVLTETIFEPAVVFS